MGVIEVKHFERQKNGGHKATGKHDGKPVSTTVEPERAHYYRKVSARALYGDDVDHGRLTAAQKEEVERDVAHRLLGLEAYEPVTPEQMAKDAERQRKEAAPRK